MLDVALDYLRRGWSIVPCRPGARIPMVKWLEFSTRLPTEKEVRAWWKAWPNAGVIIICGRVSNLVVVDVDPRKGGRKEVQEESGLISATGGGGWHFFHSYPEGIQNVPNSVGKAWTYEGEGIDVRADGGYVVAPPTVHSETGVRYKWLKQGEPTPTPTWVLNRDQTRRKENTPGEKWLYDLLTNSEPGSRNDNTARLTGYLAKKEIPEDVGEVLVQNWNRAQKEPLSSGEISTTVKSVYRTVNRKSRDTATRSTARKTSQTSGGFSLMSFNEYMVQFGGAETSWMVEGWLPKNTIAFLASPPGGFKTWLTLDLAISVASGRDFLGSAKVIERGPVVLVQQEDFHGQMADRLGTVTLSKHDVQYSNSDGNDNFHFNAPPSDIPLYVHPDRLLRFADADVMEGLEETVKRLRPILVIIDPLYSAASSDDYMAKSVEDMMALKRMRDEYDCSFLLVHHTKKSAEDWDRQNMWGSQFLNAFLETGWQVRKLDEENQIVVKRHFKSAQDPEQLKVSFNINTGSEYEFSVSVSKATEEEVEQAASKKSSKANVDSYVENLAEHGPCTAGELALRMGKNKSSVSRALKKLQDKGRVKKDSNGVWAEIDLPGF